MTTDPFQELEERVLSLVQTLNQLKVENGQLRQENDRLSDERAGLKARIDSILKRLEGV